MLIRPRFVRSRSRMDRCRSTFRKARGKHDQASHQLSKQCPALIEGSPWINDGFGAHEFSKRMTSLAICSTAIYCRIC